MEAGVGGGGGDAKAGITNYLQRHHEASYRTIRDVDPSAGPAGRPVRHSTGCARAGITEGQGTHGALRGRPTGGQGTRCGVQGDPAEVSLAGAAVRTLSPGANRGAQTR
jgi:hypothetical protein